MSGKPQRLSLGQRTEVEVLIKSSLLKYLLLMLALLGGLMGISLWQIWTKVRNQMQSLVASQFEEPQIRKVVSDVAAMKSESILVAQIQPEVDKFRSEIETKTHGVDKKLLEFNKDLDSVRSLSSDTKSKSERLSEVLAEAQKVLGEVRATSNFSFLLARVANDDRRAFDSIMNVFNDKTSPFCALAGQNMMKTAADSSVSNMLRYMIDWQKTYNCDPKKAPLNQLVDVYGKESPFRRPTVLTAICEQERFPKSDRLNLVYGVIKFTPSIRCLSQACELMNKEAHIDKNIMSYAEYLTWWEQNKSIYELAALGKGESDVKKENT